MKTNLVVACIAATLQLMTYAANAADIQPAITEFNALHHAKAKPMFAALLKDAQHQNLANYYLGRIELGYGHFAEARAFFEKSLEIEPNSAEEYYWLSTACGALLQQPSESKNMDVFACYGQNMAAALDANPNYVPALQTMYQMVSTMQGGGTPEDAAELLARIETVSKADADTSRLVVLNIKKEFEKARELAQMVATKHRQSARALLEAGKTFSNLGKTDEAIAALEAATALNLTTDNRQWMQAVYLEIGTMSWRSKSQLERGIAALLKGVEPEVFPVSMNSNWIYWRLAQLSELKGDVTQQKKYLAALEATGIEKAAALTMEMQASKK